MALARQATAPATITQNNNGGSQAYTVDAGTDRCLVVRAGGEGDLGAGWRLGTLTYGGVACTRLGGSSTANWSWVDVWILVNPPTGSNTLAWTIHKNGVQSGDPYSLRVECWTDVHQSTPNRTLQAANGTAANTTTLTVPSVAATDKVLDVVSRDGGGVALNPGANQTEDWQSAPAGCDVAGSTQNGSDGGAMNYTFTANPWTYCAFALIQAAASGTNHTVNIDDTLALADAVTPAVGNAEIVGDSLGLSDAVSTATAYQRSVDDAMALSDAATPSVAVSLGLGDNLGLADQATPARGIARQVDDPLALADQTVALLVLVAQVDDTLALADAQQLARGIAPTIADTLGLADQATPSIARAISMNDPLALADALATASTYQRVIADPLALSDQAQAGLAYAAIINDPLALADQVTPEILAGYFVQVDDTLALADQLAMARTIATQLADPLALADAQQLARGHGRLIEDALALADAQQLARGFGLSLADALALTDLIKVLGALGSPTTFILTAADRRAFVLTAQTKPQLFRLSAEQAAPFGLTMEP